jgi:hypothetical protein
MTTTNLTARIARLPGNQLRDLRTSLAGQIEGGSLSIAEMRRADAQVEAIDEVLARR